MTHTWVRVDRHYARRLFALALTLLTLAVLAPRVGAQEDVTVDTDFSGGEIGAGINGSRPGGGGNGGGGGSAGGFGGLSPFITTVVPLQGPCQNDPARPGVVFRLVLITITARSTGAVLSSRSQCVAEDEPDPPPPPPAPSYAELRSRAPIPPPAFHIAPATHGLTGLATEMSSTGAISPQSISVSLRGWNAAVHARAVSIRWTVSGPQSATYTGVVARHTFERVGTYTITLSITWAADADVSGYGVSNDVDLGVRTSSISRTYPVRELRSSSN